jgi:LSD1 subclass zinc finger protein
MVILDVSKKNVPVDRTSLELADTRPEQWSVVKWQPGKPLPHRMSERNLPRIYAVCPSCRARSMGLSEGVKELKCSDCNYEGLVDWENAC